MLKLKGKNVLNLNELKSKLGVYAPKIMMKSIGTFVKELLNYIIDFLHEDFNLVLKKPSIDYSTIKNVSDKEMGEIYWDGHLKRNLSIFCDTFQQQIKSVWYCNICRNRNVSFEPFIVLGFDFDINDKNEFTIDECFQKFSKTKICEKYCPICRNFQMGQLSKFFWTFPEYLILSFQNILKKRIFSFPDLQLDLTLNAEIQNRFYIYEIVSICDSL